MFIALMSDYTHIQDFILIHLKYVVKTYILQVYL